MAHVLIVEDEPTHAALIARVCCRQGHTVDLASDGHEALVKLGTTPFALIVTDIRLPEIDGLSLTRRIRASETLSHLPVIGLTAAPSEVAAAHEVGMSHVMLKPFELRALGAVIEEQLSAEALPITCWPLRGTAPYGLIG